ncbi:GMC family oxidoreductase [Aureimonas sp. AU22]|uniref:GMC family oxidoreductase n=1 Tax=Aureimonas sp. AU22 TaxID=1638162 RepID=UPI000782D3A5|nr:GMC family oxidoreductase [Aureimonas sp. AU22]
MPPRFDDPPRKLSTDVLVIGSGPGGCVTATVLADAGKDVLVLEEGADLSIHSAPHFSREEILQKYRNAGIGLAHGPLSVAYVEGRCVGGGSEVNRGLYHRTPDYVLDEWSREFGVDRLSSEVLRPHFEACESVARVEAPPEGVSRVSAKLGDGASRLGWEATVAQRLVRYGAETRGRDRQTMTETFVPRFQSRGGQLITRTRVERMSRSGGRWHAHARQHTDDGAERSVEIVANTVFVACGAVQTPALLRRAGIGRNIGDSLRFHPMVKIVAEFPDEVNRPGDLDPVHQVKEFEPTIGMGCSVTRRPMLKLATAHLGDDSAYVDANWRRMGIYYAQTTGGRASVRNLPFMRDPLVRVRHSTQDRIDLARAFRLLAEALFAAGALALYPAVAGYPVLRSPLDLCGLPDVFAGADGSLTSVHVFSSCPMGENERRCATDSFGAVRDVDDLHIADASLLCGPTSVNPQGTVMAIAHRNAIHALERGLRH